MNLQQVKTAIKNKIKNEKNHIISIKRTFKAGGYSSNYEANQSNILSELANINQQIHNSNTMNAVFKIHGIKNHIPNGSIKNMYNKYHGKTNNNKPEEQSEFQIFKAALVNNITKKYQTLNYQPNGAGASGIYVNTQNDVRILQNLKNQIKSNNIKTHNDVFNISGIHTVLPKSGNIRSRYNEYRHQLYIDLNMDKIIKDYIPVINHIFLSFPLKIGNNNRSILNDAVELINLIHNVIKLKSPHAIRKLYEKHMNIVDFKKKVYTTFTRCYVGNGETLNGIKYQNTCTHDNYDNGDFVQYKKFHFTIDNNRNKKFKQILTKYPNRTTQ